MAKSSCGTPGYVAPEVLQQLPYGKACDYWSIGVVAFILLSGTPPFYEEDTYELYETIKACKYNFNDPSWKNVTDEAKDFISKILVADPEKRMSSSQMMSHPWMLAELDSNTCLDHTKSKLTKYVTKRKEDSKRELLENDQDQDDL